MNFARPQLLWLLLLLLPLAGLLVWSWRVRQRLLTRFVSARLLASLTSGVSRERQKFRLVLFCGAVAALLFSLSRPQYGFSLEETKQAGLDIVIAIDTSKSMLANDVQPNRLQRAKLAGDGNGRRAAHLVLARPFGQILRDQRVEFRLCHGAVHAGLHVHRHLQKAGLFELER